MDFQHLTISPAIWPGKNLEFQPGDLSAAAQYANNWYGYDETPFEPISGAPPCAAYGGVIYFADTVHRDEFDTFLNMLGLSLENLHYAAFVQESTNPMQDKYFKQLRIVPAFALRYLFGAIQDAELRSFEEQPMPLSDALFGFILAEKERVRTRALRIAGTMGGDGEWEQEGLSFGFMLENSYHGVCRIWSRAWLISK